MSRNVSIVYSKVLNYPNLIIVYEVRFQILRKLIKVETIEKAHKRYFY